MCHCTLEPSCTLGNSQGSNSFLRDEDQKDELKEQFRKVLPGRRKCLFPGRVWQVGTLFCFHVFLQMPCFSFTSRHRETGTHRQTNRKEGDTERPRIAKRWRENEMGMKMWRKNPKEYLCQIYRRRVTFKIQSMTKGDL